MTTYYYLAPFEQWLRDHPKRYAETTVKNTVNEVDLALRNVARGRVPALTGTGALRRFRAFVDEVGSTIDPRLVGPILAAAERPETRKGRKRSAKSIDDASWRLLCEMVARDPEPEARVLEVQCATGLRVGDVLRITRTSLANALKTGSLYIVTKGNKPRELQIEGFEEWVKLFAQWHDDILPEARAAPLIAGWLCPSNPSPLPGACAYQRVHRTLKRIAEELQIPGVDLGSFHTHRIRRTVGVQALRHTGDVKAVQELLDHSSMQTTLGYLDEARPHAVAELQQQLKDRFRKKD